MEDEEQPIVEHTDFTLAFDDGRTLLLPTYGSLTLQVVHVGDLIVTTGRIVACDPYLLADAPEPYTTAAPTGRFPVLLSVASFADGDRRNSCAMLRFSEEPPVRWEMALRPGQDPATLQLGEVFSYGVDAGTGCFTDQATMEALLAQTADVDPDEWNTAFGPFGDRLFELQKGSQDGVVLITRDDGEPGNLIAFSSGWGDGTYASYFGYDAQDRLACLVTDFEVLSDAS